MQVGTVAEASKILEPEVIELTQEEKENSQYVMDGMLRLCDIDSSKSGGAQVWRG